MNQAPTLPAKADRWHDLTAAELAGGAMAAQALRLLAVAEELHTGAPFAQAQTEAFTVLAVCQWFNVLNCRSETHSALSFSIFKNYWLVSGLLLGNALHFLVIDAEPMNRVFHTVPIPLAEFFLIGVVASSVLWAEEIRKFVARRQIRTDSTR